VKKTPDCLKTRVNTIHVRLQVNQIQGTVLSCESDEILQTVSTSSFIITFSLMAVSSGVGARQRSMFTKSALLLGIVPGPFTNLQHDTGTVAAGNKFVLVHVIFPSV
jgi:hypothetical protein